MVCYSCQEEGHIASQCPKIHFIIDRSETIGAHLKQDTEFRKTFERRPRHPFSPRNNLEVLRNEASRLAHTLENLETVLLQTQENETYANFFSDEFYALLEKKIYLPYYQKFGYLPEEGLQINSIGSVEILKPQPDTLQPPPMFHRAESGGIPLHSNLTPDYGSRGHFPFQHQSSIANGIPSSQENNYLHRLGSNMPKQGSMNPDHPPARVRFDTVQHFEIYYPHGNITVISKKYNIQANETMAALTLARKSGYKVNRNILKSIDILSGGSIYGNLKKSAESMISINSPTKKKSIKDPESRNNSLFMTRLAKSSSHIMFGGESSQSDATRKHPEANLAAPGKRDSSLYLNPERLNDSSVVSSASVIYHHAKDNTDASPANRRLSRFGPQNKVGSSSFIGSDYPKASASNLDEKLLLAPNSFGTEQNITSSILPQSNFPESSSNNNIVNFWKERNKASFQKSEASVGSFASPTFKKLSVDGGSRLSQADSRMDSESFIGNNESRSQISLFANKRGEDGADETPLKHSSDKKMLQAHFRKAIRTMKEIVDKKNAGRKSQFAQKKKTERSNSVGKESKLAKLIKREGFIKPLHDLIVVIQSDKKIFLENFVGVEQK